MDILIRSALVQDGQPPVDIGIRTYMPLGKKRREKAAISS